MMVYEDTKTSLRRHWYSVPAWVWSLLKWGVSLGLLLWLAIQTDWRAAIAVVGVVPWYYTMGGFGCMVMAQLLGAYRLQMLLQAQAIPIPYAHSVRLTFMGLFAGNFLPSSVGGDAVKLLALGQQGYPRVVVAACLVADRGINIIAALCFLPAVFFVPVFLDIAYTWIRVVSMALIITLLGIALIILALRSYARYRVRHNKTPLPSRIHRIIASLRQISEQWVAHPMSLIWALIISWGNILAGIGTIWVAAVGIGIEIPFIEITAVVMLMYFLVMLPISFNGLGIQEVSMTYLLIMLGSSPEHGLALAILSRMIFVGVSALGAVALLMWKREETHAQDAH